MYENFVTAGEKLLAGMLLAVKSYNKSKAENRQSVAIAIASPPPEVERVLGFLQYAGLVRFDRRVSRGVKGRFNVYNLHAAGLIDQNVLLGRKSVRADAFSAALAARSAHEFTRVTPEKLLGVNDAADVLTLALPPCPSCGTARADESAKFCLECGSPLTAVSTFNTLVKKDISVLPLTATRVARIREHSKIRTVGDILLDHERRELRSVPRVGPYWAQRIYSYAEEFIA